MVPNDISAPETGNVPDPTGTILGPVVIEDELDFDRWGIR